MSRRVVLATFGSYGDLNPFLGVAGELARRGYEPIIASSPEWRLHVENAGFEFREVRPGWDMQVDPSRHMEQLAARGVFTDFRASYDDLMSAVRDADALVTLTLVTAGPLVARKAGLPWVSVVLEPLSFFSSQSLQLPEGMTLPALKEAVGSWAEPVFRLRDELGLPRGRDPFFEEYLSADAILALFSPQLGSREPDWPPQSVVTGFVAYDKLASRDSNPAMLREFLAAGPAPIVFTLSSDAVIAPADNFYWESLTAARMLGYRAVLLGLNLPEARDADALMLSHAPFSEVFPHAAAVVYHGGMGTTAIALKAGRPLLVVPGSFAQPDIAARLVRLGVARSVPRASYSATAAAAELWTLLSNPEYAARAAAAGRQCAAEDGAAAACDVIERVINRSVRSMRPLARQLEPAQETAKASARLLPDQATIYLHIFKKVLTRFPLEPTERLLVLALRDMDPALTHELMQWAIASQSVWTRSFGFHPVRRSLGLDWPQHAETMIGLYRLNNIEQCVVSALERRVPGDLVEMGVWRGGASIFMRAVLKAFGDEKRKVWLADSFQGLPKPDAETYAADRGDKLWAFRQLAVSLDTVRANFARYGLLDDQVRFLPGWFRDTLPAAPIERIAVLRLDGDMYESTILPLRALYDKVSPGGFVIVDDYHSLPPCRQAVEEFRSELGIFEPLVRVDWTGVFWQKRAGFSIHKLAV